MDVFIQQYFGVKLKDTQQVIARAVGLASNSRIVKSRGYGKTWLIAWCAVAIAILYPGTSIGVVSATAAQATLVLKKIKKFTRQYSILAGEMVSTGKDFVRISKDKGYCEFLNGSSIESFSINQVVGERTKVLIIDEAPRANEQDIKKNAEPTLNTTRDCCIQGGYDDFSSKIIYITSACLKSNFFYRDFVKAYEAMRSGDPTSFACVLNYQSAVRCGLTKASYFEGRKKALPESVFATEYGSYFLGAEAGTLFPFDLTDTVRTLRRVEAKQPRNSKCWYIISIDLASSDAKGADNAVLVVIKCVDKEDGTVMKNVVYIRSYHGWRLNALANEVRKVYVSFPGTVRIIYDAKGLGFSFAQFFSEPWIDDTTGKEYEPWTDEHTVIPGANPLLFAFKATPVLNVQLVSTLRVALEQKTVAFPVPSTDIDDVMVSEEDDDEGDKIVKLSMEESAIYLEADALQVELGSIVSKSTMAGNVVYDTEKKNQHKDRYSALAMGVWYISQVEEDNKRRLRNRGNACIGIVDSF